jgi:hypothetical protein
MAPGSAISHLILQKVRQCLGHRQLADRRGLIQRVMAAVGLISLLCGAMAHQISHRCIIYILILQQNRETQPGTRPSDMLAEPGSSYPLIKCLITAVVRRQREYLVGNGWICELPPLSEDREGDWMQSQDVRQSGLMLDNPGGQPPLFQIIPRREVVLASSGLLQPRCLLNQQMPYLFIRFPFQPAIDINVFLAAACEVFRRHEVPQPLGKVGDIRLCTGIVERFCIFQRGYVGRVPDLERDQRTPEKPVYPVWVGTEGPECSVAGLFSPAGLKENDGGFK